MTLRERADAFKTKVAVAVPPISLHEAMRRLVVEYDETLRDDGALAARGVMIFPSALEGPPGRLHGGHHAFVRIFPILERITAHAPARTFPCAIDVQLLRSLPLEAPVAFEASYRAAADGWHLTTRLDGTDRLLADARSLPPAPLMDPEELARWRRLYEESQPAEGAFRMFGLTLHLAPKLVWVESEDPRRTDPESQHAALVEPSNTFGPAFVATQLDMVGAVAQGTRMRHPHFTKHIALEMAVGSIPAGERLLCLADRTTMVEDTSSATEPVEIDGRRWGTVQVPVALVDAAFKTVYATGRVTVHPVDPRKFEPLQKMRALRQDL